MPQLDPTTFAPQLIWLAITFVLLYVLMASVGLPRVAKVLDERQARIDSDLAAAYAARQQSEAVLAAYEKELADARARATVEVQSQLAAAAAAAGERERAAMARLAEQAEAATVRIAEAKTNALTHLRDVAAEVARDATTRLLGFVPDDRVLADAVDTALEGRG